MTNTLHQLNSTWINGARIKLERGNICNIGRVWWNGGALEFARYMNYDIPGLNYYEGDYIAHDKHIVDWLLMVYQATNLVYFDFTRMTENEKKAFIFANADTMFNMVVKPTCHTGNVWRILKGYLYSGGKETSNAGSFCTMLCFAIFLCYQMSQYPGLASQIMECIEGNFISIAIYGDDHLWCAPRVFRGILDEVQFARVSKLLFGMEIQDIMEYEHFLSKPNLRNGDFIRRGPKFLKRYFIAGDVCEVLPYKPASETFSKLFAPTSSIVLDSILRTIGQAWDTMFTNEVSYLGCRLVYRELVKLDTRTPFQILLDLDPDDPNIHLMAKKLNMDVNILLAGFPDYNERREQFHVYDSNKVRFVLEDPRAQLYEDYTF